MKLKVFQSDKGDCLLLEANSGELVLCDGGMGPSMRNHVRAELGALRDAGRDLDFVYISHIDNDHVSGVLQLLEDEVEWRVFLHHQDDPDEEDPVAVPTVPRPPRIKGILHNGFRDVISANEKAMKNLFAAQAMEDLLSTMTPTLFATAVPELVDAAEEMQSIATGVPEGIQVSKLVAANALNIPLNQPPGVTGPGKLLFAGNPGDKFTLGSMQFTLIGPTDKELRKVRDGWNNWLRENREGRLKELRAELKKRIEEFTTGELSGSPFDLSDWEGIPNFKGVTAPNIASLMFMVEENGKRLLLTGDGQQSFIIAGLERTGFLDDGFIHLDVLKVQHHGSEKNIDVDFARRVSADNYVFCGNGEHKNPDLSVIDIIFKSRLGGSAVRALAPEAENRDFHFWFSTTSDAQDPNSAKRTHFEKVEEKVNTLVGQSNGLLHLHFNVGASTDLNI